MNKTALTPHRRTILPILPNHLDNFESVTTRLRNHERIPRQQAKRYKEQAKQTQQWAKDPATAAKSPSPTPENQPTRQVLSFPPPSLQLTFPRQSATAPTAAKSPVQPSQPTSSSPAPPSPSTRAPPKSTLQKPTRDVQSPLYSAVIAAVIYGEKEI